MKVYECMCAALQTSEQDEFKCHKWFVSGAKVTQHLLESYLTAAQLGRIMWMWWDTGMM